MGSKKLKLPSGLLLGICPQDFCSGNHSGNCPKPSGHLGIVWTFCTKKWWGAKNSNLPSGLLLGICPQDFCSGNHSGNCLKCSGRLGIVWTFCTWWGAKNLNLLSGLLLGICPWDFLLGKIAWDTWETWETVPSTQVTWELFEFFALRSDGEQKTKICPWDFCFGFALGISTWENCLANLGNCSKCSGHLGIVWTFCTKKWWGAKKLKFAVRITAVDLPLGFPLGKITWDTWDTRETVPSTQVAWELFELFALRSDGEPLGFLLGIFPQDFCLGKSLRILGKLSQALQTLFGTVLSVWYYSKLWTLSQVLGTLSRAQKTVPSAQDSPEGKFQFFAPHCPSVQKVQTSSITANSGQVSPPPATRITTP